MYSAFPAQNTAHLNNTIERDQNRILHMNTPLKQCAYVDITLISRTASNWRCLSGIWQRSVIPGFSEATTILHGLKGIQMSTLQPQTR